LIIPLMEATPQNAGAKAAVLGRLIRAGFPVPPGFVIPVDAYRAVTAHLDLTIALSSPDPTQTRRLVEAQPIPPPLLTDLANALTNLTNPADPGHPADLINPGDLVEQSVAVRSSATTEDTPTSSAAGQHDSFLGVRGLSAVAARVQAIWGSLWSQRAIAYRRAHPTAAGQADRAADPPVHASPTDPGIAVIVQRHVDAEVAGVLFTADRRIPNSTAVLEASWGLGESVVQGTVNPDTYTLNTGASGAPSIIRQLGSKQTRTDRAPDPSSASSPSSAGSAFGRAAVATSGSASSTASSGCGSSSESGSGIVVSEVGLGQRREFCLSDRQVLRIMQLGQEVADYLGGPQDIEFAVENDRIWLLQARPITVPLQGVESVDQAAVESEVDERDQQYVAAGQLEGDRLDEVSAVPTGVPTKPPGLPAELSGVPAAPPGVPSESPGVLAEQSGAQGASPGAPAEPTDVPDESRGVAAELSGAQAVRPGVQAEPPGVPAVPTGVPAVPTGVPAESTGVPAVPVGELAGSEVGAVSGEVGEVAEAGGAERSAVNGGELGAEGESAGAGGVLRGIGGSAGVASGPARVVHGVEDFARVRVGDILVCRFTDPAWTPLFDVVVGVVTEVGGRLSHAAIVAREHRIPAVLGVPDVMSRLADGQLVTIVGNTGLVRPEPQSCQAE
jgi:pyruvate,water dikinase